MAGQTNERSAPTGTASRNWSENRLASSSGSRSKMISSSEATSVGNAEVGLVARAIAAVDGATDHARLCQPFHSATPWIDLVLANMAPQALQIERLHGWVAVKRHERSLRLNRCSATISLIPSAEAAGTASRASSGSFGRRQLSDCQCAPPARAKRTPALLSSRLHRKGLLLIAGGRAAALYARRRLPRAGSGPSIGNGSASARLADARYLMIHVLGPASRLEHSPCGQLGASSAGRARHVDLREPFCDFPI